MLVPLAAPSLRLLVIALRVATPADIDFAREVHHQAYRDVVERQFGPWNASFQDQRFAEGWASATFSIVLCDDEPCGYLCVEDRANDLHVREIVIAPAFQGRGIGTTLLQDVLQRAGSRGVPVRLGTFHANRAATLYRRLGFQEVAHTPTHLLLEWRPTSKRGQHK